MANKSNFLLGYGERLVEQVVVTIAGDKTHPYTFEEARARLAPQIKSAAREIESLPPEACPKGQTVALVTLHPAYLAKTYFPEEFLRTMGANAVGSRAHDVTPEKWTATKAGHPAVTAEIFIAAPRQAFQSLARTIDRLDERTQGAKDLRKIYDFRVQDAKERIKPLRSDAREPLLEIVLHAQPIPEFDFVIEGFEAFLAKLDLKGDFDRRIYAEGLCFMPLRVPRPKVAAVGQFSFLRVAREMPRLRQFRPLTRIVPGFTPFACKLPNNDALAPDAKVAVFDGGVAQGVALDRWVSRKKPPGLGKSVAEFESHGTAVTSSVLFGPLQDGETAPRPYANVDHWRVLDESTAKDDQDELYTVLGRIRDVLQSRAYTFVNLSLGPDLPVEDNEVHAWTAVLDQLLSSGRTLTSIAVGNGGERDRESGNARIQTPADCVNGLSIGACDRSGAKWRRAAYSSVGPGRSPGVVKPDALAFGGSSHEPYWALSTSKAGEAVPVTGTSFAAPTALRSALGIRAHFGDIITPLGLKALLLHGCEESEHDRTEVGWGRVSAEIGDLVLSDDSTAQVLYQGELSPAQWVRMRIPIPRDPLAGLVSFAATFCFATATDPQDPINYTRSGLEVIFRPHDGKRTEWVDKNGKKRKPIHPNSKPFFQAREFYMTETELREDAHKWETTLRHRQSMRGSSLRNPAFDVHYNARSGGRDAKSASPIPYALVVTVHSPRTKNLYNLIVQRYRTILEPLQPAIQIPVRT